MAEHTSTGTHGHTKQGNGSSLEGGLTGAAGEAASGLMAQVKSRASSQVAAQQVKAADGLGNVADALRKAGNELRSHNEGLASYADMAVDEIEHISSRIRDKSPGEYVSDLEHFARSRPAAFVGGTFLLGLALARFLKSTQPRRPRAYSGSATGQGGYRGDPGQRAYGSAGAAGRWPESTGSVTPPAPGRTSTSSGSGPGTVGASLTSGTQANAGAFGDADKRNAGSSSGTQAGSRTQESTESSFGAGTSAAGRGRGTGEGS